jgi:hypothetical protein
MDRVELAGVIRGSGFRVAESGAVDEWVDAPVLSALVAKLEGFAVKLKVVWFNAGSTVAGCASFVMAVVVAVEPAGRPVTCSAAIRIATHMRMVTKVKRG